MFPKKFAFGTATSSYQIEGNNPDMGGGASVWDEFVKRSGVIDDGSTGEIACDHINRYGDDFKLMSELGIKHYKFSVSWAKIMPHGIGVVNERAISIYRDMILKMKKYGITPYLTLFHWEYPQELMEKGGWLNPKSPEWFYEYAKVVAENFTDIVDYFFTIDGPQSYVGYGHILGIHAPGYKFSKKGTFIISHNILKAHGYGVKALREFGSDRTKVGIASTAIVAYPYTECEADISAARKVYFGCDWPEKMWCLNVTWFLDPIVLGHYPEDAMKKHKEYLPHITARDMKLISQPIDYIGQNIYNGYWIAELSNGYPIYIDRPEDYPKTGIGWPVTPECLFFGPKFLYERYHLPIYITENGAAYSDKVVKEDVKRVHDESRVEFIGSYLKQIKRALENGIDIRGYFLRSFLDNFEWSSGYTQRFGIVYVNFETQERIKKDSAYYYQKVCESNGEIL